MKGIITALFIIFSGIVFSQKTPVKLPYLAGNDVPKKTAFHLPKKATVNYKSTTNNYAPSLLLREMPRQGSKKMELYNYPQNKNFVTAGINSGINPLILGQSFMGNPFAVSTPNDNDIAVSDSFVVSVINTSIYIKNIKTNALLGVKSLEDFTDTVNDFHEEFDPKVMYDPNTDRFVIVSMVGSVDTTSKIIVGFSKTHNPAGEWNLYTLPGDALNNNLWSDYPMIAMTGKELFLSINLLYNDSTWQAGFVETIVWQIEKADGYAGDTLTSVLHSNIKFNGKPIRNLCPVKGGSKLYSPNMYFVSNRNLASQNDTVFLVNITDTINAPAATLTTKVIKTNISYFFPADGRQTIATQSLATNDCRNLGAFYENNNIQYVHNTNNPLNGHPTVYYGVISGINTNTPSISGFILPNDTMDFAYPNISYAGNGPSDNTAIINFNHSSNKVNPGCSAIQSDAGGTFSNILRIKNGATYVNLLNSSLERWGDYSGSQRIYNKPGEVWISGYYGYVSGISYPRAHGAWIAQLSVDNIDYSGVKENAGENQSVSVFPNPMETIFSLTFELLDGQAKLVTVLLRDWVKVTHNVFSFNTRDLGKGVYFLRITGNGQTNVTKKIIIQ